MLRNWVPRQHRHFASRTSFGHGDLPRSSALIRSATGAVPQAAVHTMTSEELRSEPRGEKAPSAAGTSGGKVPIRNQDGDHHWEHVRLKEFMAIERYNTDQAQERVKRSWDSKYNSDPSSSAHPLPSFKIFCVFVGHSTAPLKCMIEGYHLPASCSKIAFPLRSALRAPRSKFCFTEFFLTTR